MAEHAAWLVRLRSVTRSQWVGPLLAVIAIWVLFAALTPATFTSLGILEIMALQTVIVAIASVGMTLIIIVGGIDLSVGAIVALTTVAVARALQAGAGPYEAVLVGAAAGAACGLVNGALVASLRITPFIVTLGTMCIFRGAAIGLAHEQKIDTDHQGLRELMALLPENRSWMIVPPGVWIALVVALVVAGVLGYTRFGRRVVAIGSNEQTARLCGIPVGRVTIYVYALAGLLAGIAGVLEFGTLTVGDPTDSVGLELSVIAAVVIGGASLNGGQGSVAGAIFGAILMMEIRSGCAHLGIPNWVQLIITGFIIIVAVAIDRWRQRT